MEAEPEPEAVGELLEFGTALAKAPGSSLLLATSDPLKPPLEPKTGPAPALGWAKSDPQCPGTSPVRLPVQVLIIGPMQTAKSPVSTGKARLPHSVRPRLDQTRTGAS